MDPWLLFALLIVLAIACVAAELHFYTHGLLSLAALLLGALAVWVAYAQNRWVGLGMAVALMLAVPVTVGFVVKFWSKLPGGKKIILTAVTPPVEHERVKIGMVGRTVSTLRPMGEAEFGVITAQVLSDFGTVEPGTAVQVVSITPDGIARVRKIAESANTSTLS